VNVEEVPLKTLLIVKAGVEVLAGLTAAGLPSWFIFILLGPGA
jgi:hypothetical protein